MVHSHNEMKYRNEKAQTTPTHSNMDKFPNIMLSEIRQTQKSNTTRFHLYKFRDSAMMLKVQWLPLGA